ncbi:hypothetical protein SIID45300_01656 [Candidatus Magnetaquicoccaceae bacterium FCR-1]|uniref:Uncharacterized protein n=1 Tax=Candidatus Magnetaquiglobus chichijimensis TaxID=3141448 RepID=A0ABQ0C8W5_9PROT
MTIMDCFLNLSHEVRISGECISNLRNDVLIT